MANEGVGQYAGEGERETGDGNGDGGAIMS